MMSKKLTYDLFVSKARIIHSNLYDYSTVNYINNDTKISIICKKHGEFLQSPKKHLMGRGCWLCGKTKIKPIKMLEEFFIQTQFHLKRTRAP